MKKNWISLAGCLALAASQTALFAQDDETAPKAAAQPAIAAEPTPAAPVPAAPNPAVPEPVATTPVPPVTRGLQPFPEFQESSAIGFRRVTSTGGFVKAERTTVRVARDGRIVQVRRVGEGGVAQISEISPGAYSVFANGNEGFAAFGTYLGDVGHSDVNRIGLIPQHDSPAIRRFIANHLQNNVAGHVPAAQEVARGSVYENSDFELQPDGSVKGQIVRAAPTNHSVFPIADMSVAFVRDGQVVSESRSDANGDFTLSGISSGIYSLAAAGPEGFVCFSTGVIQPAAHAQARVRRFEFVAVEKAAVTVTAVVPVSPLDYRLFNQLPSNPSNSNQGPMAGSGGMGSGGGGAGGGGAGGGFGGGGLLGALAGAGIGAALANQNGGGNTPATPAVP